MSFCPCCLLLDRTVVVLDLIGWSLESKIVLGSSHDVRVLQQFISPQTILMKVPFTKTGYQGNPK